MSINHYSSDSPQSSLWWTQQHQPITTSGAGGLPIIPLQPSWHRQQPTFLNSHNPCFNLNNQVDDDDDDDNTTITIPQEELKEEEEEEAMFEKALTPSDVGKLNRLVIPKQQAEKYFPLGGDSAESKGLLLSFEDESGKCWRFRYSYWNSSQSYVLTKGWSRYVKDKRLDAGDVVLFQRHRATANRLFIRWRRRHSTTAPAHISKSSSTTGGGGFYSAHHYPVHHHHPFPYQPNSLHAGGGSQSQGEKQTTQVGSGSGSSSSSRVLRLFGVNMECQPDNDSETLRPECSSSYNNMSSTQGTPTHHFYHHQPS